MRFFSFCGVFFYTLILSLIGGLIIGFSLHIIQIQDVFALLEAGYNAYNMRIITGLIGLLLILVSIAFAQLILGRIQKERTIAFNNPSGQVTVSLSAVEDLVKRLTANLTEIKETRPDVIATKKGIQIDLRVVLRSESNIPDLTLKLQELIKSRIQDILGVEETVIIRVHVAKIITTEEEKDKRKKGIEKEEPMVPFQNYGTKL
jgi:uncharacterized alkaline shock family protein YloU